MTALWGTLTLPELAMLLSNLIGLVLAVAVTGESQMDFEAIRILGQRGLIAGADVRQRTLKAKGNRRDEALKMLVHTVLLAVGIIISASPTPRQEYEEFTALWLTAGVTVVALALAVGSVFNLMDRRTLWALFATEDDSAATAEPQGEAEPMAATPSPTDEEVEPEPSDRAGETR